MFFRHSSCNKYAGLPLLDFPKQAPRSVVLIYMQRLSRWASVFHWLVIAGASWCAHISLASVIITEIMFAPQASDRDSIGVDYTYNREWVELFNTGSSPVDLTDWQFGDSLDNTWANPFPANTILNPQQALVVTGDAASFDANWGTGINRVEVG